MNRINRLSYDFVFHDSAAKKFLVMSAVSGKDLIASLEGEIEPF